MCFGYVAAVIDDARHDLPRDSERFCLPQFTDLDRFRLVIVNHFADHPAGLSAPSFLEARHALVVAFPCGRTTRRPSRTIVLESA